ncbi:hypothetical protein CDAR_455381 [Caerostris darwini]|uniref:Uncharacterized protein n=1 Tax=Caerostris darwini TaxID=1538125 RepID=A0AAV4TPN8_9ARAC|nr:hypothetical protein CDAR_455381 [Caerostris darwini]
MEITKCEYCDAYITKFDVHNCVRFGNQYRQCSTTLPQCSSRNLDVDIELITEEEMEYEARWPSLNQTFHFPSKPYVKENEYKSVNLQQSSEPIKVLRSLLSQLSVASNPGHLANSSTSLEGKGFLNGFQTWPKKCPDEPNGSTS